jgi:purine nucleoside phosphorylase
LLLYEDAGMAKKIQSAKGRGARTEAARIGIIGGSGLYSMPGF